MAYSRRSRRSRQAGSQSSEPSSSARTAQVRHAESDAAGIEEEEQQYDAAETDAVAEEEAGGSRSSRRTATSRRSSRKSSRTTQRKSRGKTKAPAIELSPEELQTQQEQRAQLIRMVGGSIVVAVVIVVLVVLMLPNPTVDEARAKLQQASSHFKEVSALINQAQVEQAQTGLQRLRELLDDPVYAQADASYQQRAEALQQRLQPLQEKVQGALDRRAAERNLAVLKQRLSNVRSETDLAALLGLLEGFRRNPIDPAGVALANPDQHYSDLIVQVLDKERVIEAEQTRRADTSGIEQEARTSIERLVQKREYKNAATKLAEFKQQAPTADFAALDSYVVDSQKREWEAIRDQVRQKVQIASGAGASDSVREAERQAASELLKQVEENYEDEYVQQAEALRRELSL